MVKIVLKTAGSWKARARGIHIPDVPDVDLSPFAMTVQLSSRLGKFEFRGIHIPDVPDVDLSPFAMTVQLSSRLGKFEFRGIHIPDIPDVDLSPFAMSVQLSSRLGKLKRATFVVHLQAPQIFLGSRHKIKIFDCFPHPILNIYLIKFGILPVLPKPWNLCHFLQHKLSFFCRS
jgi:hypothetical protein